MKDVKSKSCNRCGSEFFKPYKISMSQWESRVFCSKKCSATKIDIDINEIRRLYEYTKKSSTEIAQELGISGVHVIRLLKKSGAEIRNSSENKKLSHSKDSTKSKLSKASSGRRHSKKTIDELKLKTGESHPLWRGGVTKTSQGYLQYSKSIANKEKAGLLIHHVVGKDKYGDRIKAGMHLHHVDLNKTNNNPDNLLLMTEVAHAKLHAFLRSKNGK